MENAITEAERQRLRSELSDRTDSYLGSMSSKNKEIDREYAKVLLKSKKRPNKIDGISGMNILDFSPEHLKYKDQNKQLTHIVRDDLIEKTQDKIAKIKELIDTDAYGQIMKELCKL